MQNSRKSPQNRQKSPQNRQKSPQNRRKSLQNRRKSPQNRRNSLQNRCRIDQELFFFQMQQCAKNLCRRCVAFRPCSEITPCKLSQRTSSYEGTFFKKIIFLKTWSSKDYNSLKKQKMT